MLEQGMVRAAFNTDEIEVIYIHEFPVVEIKQLKALAPPGSFMPLYDVITALRHIGSRLMRLAPSKTENYAIGVASDLGLISLVKIPSKQRKIDLEGGTDKPKPLKQEAEEEAKIANEAIEYANQLLQQRSEGKITCYEQFESELANSPNRVVRNPSPLD